MNEPYPYSFVTQQESDHAAGGLDSIQNLGLERSGTRSDFPSKQSVA